MDEQEKQARFEELIMPHLDAAYNLARWLTRNEHDAEDVVQDAFIRAFRFFDAFRGENGRSWLLAIVRNTGYSWMQKNRKPEHIAPFSDDHVEIEDVSASPELLIVKSADHQMVRQALEELATEFREVMVLRELEGLSYREIACVVDVPIGTVMSRLARARKQLQELLAGRIERGGAR